MSESQDDPVELSETEKIEQMEQDLNEFLARKGIYLPPKPESDEYLGMNMDEIMGLSPEQLGVAAFVLARHAFYVQTVLNGYEVRAHECRSHIRRLVGHTLTRFNDVYGKEEKWIVAINSNKNARKWKMLQDKAEQVIISLHDLPARLHQLSRTAMELRQSRSQSYGKVERY